MKAIRSLVTMQRGVATISITLVLLLVMSLATLYVNRVLILHQRGSTNEYHAAQAFEAAEAGLSWATTMLNDPRGIDSTCLPKAGTQSFRARYLPNNEADGFTPNPESHPACRLGEGALTCSCPGTTEHPNLGEARQPIFTISFAAIPSSQDSVLVTALGCTSPAAPCANGTNKGNAEATARLSVVLVLKPLIRVIPGAALTSGGDVSISGTARIQNTDRATNGALVDAGGLTSIDTQVHLTSLAGTPIATAIADNDASLSTSIATGGVFNTFFGMSAARFATATGVRRISGDSPSARAAALLADYEMGYSAFRVDGPMKFSESTIGSADRPVLIVSTAAIACQTACQLNGLIYNDAALRIANIGADIETRGAMISLGEHRQSNGESIVYDLDVLKTLRHQTQTFVRIPGSWHDL